MPSCQSDTKKSSSLTQEEKQIMSMLNDDVGAVDMLHQLAVVHAHIMVGGNWGGWDLSL